MTSPPLPPPELELHVATLAELDAALVGDDALGAALGARVLPGWAVFDGVIPALRKGLAADPAGARWGTRLFLLDGPRTLAGWGGFKGAPSDGAVEIGYAVAPAVRRRGLASAAVALLLAEAYAEPEVRRVLAHTMPADEASIGVLARSGFVHVGESVEHGSTVWQHVHTRD